KQHAHLEDADAVAIEVGLVEPQLDERLSHVVVRLARGQDAEPRLSRGDDDAIQLVLPRVASRQLQAGAVECPLHVETVRRGQGGVGLVVGRVSLERGRRNYGGGAMRGAVPAGGRGRGRGGWLY